MAWGRRHQGHGTEPVEHGKATDVYIYTYLSVNGIKRKNSLYFRIWYMSALVLPCPDQGRRDEIHYVRVEKPEICSAFIVRPYLTGGPKNPPL